MNGTASAPVDLLIVGGGINGAGIARDAAGRGLSVVLCEKDDLAAHTSSASTKLIHGGLRYLEYYEFGLVRKSLQERELLLDAAPHIMWPLRFVLPHAPHLRPAWMIRAGLFLYDHLARRRRLPGSEGLDLRRHEAGRPLKPGWSKAFAYSDGWVEDARLVVLNAVDARERGARILTRTRCMRLVRDGDAWIATLTRADGSTETVRARGVVNAAGPWVGQFLSESSPVQPTRGVRLVKGSHVIVPKLYDHPYAYIFQNEDKRIIFAIPYEHDFTLVGTTDVEYRGDAAKVAIDAQEVAYLCELANRYFAREIAPADVVWSYSGVRPLLDDDSDDPSSVTRDYRFELDVRGPPLLSIFGGKITTYRRLAEEALVQLLPPLGLSTKPWTLGVPLPGGDLPGADFEAYVAATIAKYPALDPVLLRRWARAYGSRLEKLLGGATLPAELGEEVLPGVYRAELDHLRRDEFATTAEDVLWRRTKLGLHLPRAAQARLDDWLARQPA